MKRATQNHKSIVVRILSKAFNENQSVNYVLKQGPGRDRRIEQLIEYSFDVCLAFGYVLIAEDGRGCALVLHPDKRAVTMKSILWDINLAINVIGPMNLNAVMKRETQVKSFHPNIPFSYLWFIGVSPEYQRNGIGGELLSHVIRDARLEERPIYLETSVNSNLPWYKKFGFKIFHTLDLGYTLYLLRKDNCE